MNKLLLLPIALVLSFVLLAGCIAQQADTNITPSTQNPGLSGDEVLSGITVPKTNDTSHLKKFASLDELKKYISENSDSGAYNYGKGMMEGRIAAPTAMPGLATDYIGRDSAQSTDGYSGTNVQVAGVDEADVVKTDGEYIYLIKNGQLIIVDARDAKNSKIIFENSMFGSAPQDPNYYQAPQPTQIFVNGNKLAVFANVPKKDIVFEKYDIVPQETYRQYTGLFVFDISDKTKPKLVSNVTVSGNYFQSRMIGDVIYFVSQDSVYNQIYPPILYAQEKIMMPDIYYFDNPQDQYVFNTVSSFDLSKNDVVESKSYLMGYSNTLMMSEDNLYVAFQKAQNWCRWCYNGQQYPETRFNSVILPMLPMQLQGEIDIIEAKSSLSKEEKWEQISAKLKGYLEPAYENSANYPNSVVKDRKVLLENIQDALAEYDAMLQIEESKTIIHKFSINNGQITHEAQGSVPGYLLNQFSMDEYDSKLRVATTVNIWAQKQVQYNNVYVLDSNMNIEGRLEKIAKDESIYSARFMGKRLYLVTYRQVDPFFAIDLSDSKNPKVLGALKIPGYSSYLHPYSENIIIGVGKQTKTNEWGGVSTTGVKISLFNVANPADPREIDTMEFGGEGSDSAVLYDHKAFLLDTSRNLMVLPLKVVETQEGFFRDKSSVWDGAVVVKITESGFEEYGIVKHSEAASQYGGWWSSNTVQRSLYIDDALYTISDEYMKVNEISSGLPQINSIAFVKKEVGIFPQIKIPFVN